MRKLLTVAAVVLTWGIASNAAAQRGGGDVEREGFLVGFSIGGGSISCSDCDGSKGGPTVDLHIGTMVNEKMAVMLDGSGIGVTEDDDYGDTMTETYTVDTIAVQYWPAERFWLKGGIGLATLRWSSPNMDTYTNNGLGMMAAAGYEIVQKGKFTLDVQARFLTASHDVFGIGEKTRFNTFMGMVGFNWY